jgi:hypothetical protein
MYIPSTYDHSVTEKYWYVQWLTGYYCPGMRHMEQPLSPKYNIESTPGALLTVGQCFIFGNWYL